MWKAVAVCAGLSIAIDSSASAAKFNVVFAQYHGAEMGLLVQGPIAPGDGTRFGMVLDGAIAKYRDHRMRIVSLDSPGGVVSEAQRR